MMRLLLVSREYPPETAHGGIGTQTYVKAHGLAARGHDVRVLSSSVNHEGCCYRDGGVRVMRIPGFENRMPLYSDAADWLTYSAEVAAAIADVHARSPIDLIDFPEWSGEGYIHLINRTEWNFIPSVVQIHGPVVMFAHTIGWPEIDSELYRVGTLMESTCLRLADAIFSSSDCSADWCAERYGLEREAIVTLHTGVDVQHFRPLPLPKHETPTIVFVGRLTADKGVQLLVDAACRVAARVAGLRVQLLGRGDTTFVDSLRQSAANAGFPDLLDLPGFVPREQLPTYLSRAHVFAGPSYYEPGPGLVYLEAMACGLPVVACASGGASEVVVSGAGVLIPPGDGEALERAIESLLSDDARRAELGMRARAYAIEAANSERNLDRLERFYLSVLERGNS